MCFGVGILDLEVKGTTTMAKRRLTPHLGQVFIPVDDITMPFDPDEWIDEDEESPYDKDWHYDDHDIDEAQEWEPIEGPQEDDYESDYRDDFPWADDGGI